MGTKIYYEKKKQYSWQEHQQGAEDKQEWRVYSSL